MVQCIVAAAYCRAKVNRDINGYTTEAAQWNIWNFGTASSNFIFAEINYGGDCHIAKSTSRKYHVLLTN